jgi:LysM repeat protein
MEVRFYEQPINPEEIIDFDRLTLRKENLFLHKAMFRPGAKPMDEIEVLSADQLAYQTYSRPVENTATALVSPIVRPKIKTQQKKYHRIESRDTLTKIARKYGTTVGTLCKLNGISLSTTLVIGRSLRVK